MATRASSKDRDLPTVLAGLLNLDVRKILEIEEADERMRILFSMLDEFPQDVLFLDGPRLEQNIYYIIYAKTTWAEPLQF